MRTGLLALLLLMLSGGMVAIRHVGQPSERQNEIVAVCDAVEAERYDEAIAASTDLVANDSDGHIAAECRCWALLNRDRRDDCARLIDDLLTEEAGADWIPHPVLATLVVRSRGEQRRFAEAATLARATSRTHPGDLRLLELEINARGRVEGERSTLAAMEKRIAETADPWPLQIALAVAHLQRSDAASALRVLADEAPAATHPLALAWFEERSRALALAGDLEGLKRLFALWRERGADPAELDARYALRLSVAHLEDPEHTEIELLRAALESSVQFHDPRLEWALYRRLIGAHIAEQRVDEALAVYDEASQRIDFPNLTRVEIERSALVLATNPAAEPTATGRLRFRLSAGANMQGELLVSPGGDAAADAGYEAFAIAPGQALEVERRARVTPQRWVLRDAEGNVRGSGSAWPVAGRVVEIEVRPREVAVARDPSAVRNAALSAPAREADGRRRVFAVVLDCADWRLVQYLRARRELPVLESLLATGYSAVLESTPAFTAAAMDALVMPMRDQTISTVGLLQRMGLELGGLASVGHNPLGFLGAFLPESQSLFDVVGAGDHVAANLLFSHGGIDAGRHAEMIGPAGEVRRVPIASAFRSFDAYEREAFPLLVTGGREQRHAETIAAELDTAVEIVRAGEVDLLLMRIEPLDLLSHAFFGDLLRGNQDDAENALLDAYRYIDWRLRELRRELDADDVLVVMSDHGIRTPMEHETDALFVVSGGDVPHGRAAGTPHLRGVPRVLAGLLGVATPWPDSGVAAWVAPGARFTTASARAGTPR